MFPLWDIAIAPVLRAAGARRIVEIGALRGETTVKMLDDLGPDAELHVIDPVPEFDPREHERAFPGRYVFHEALSLDVLPSLPPMDAALVDGDHNWYTVYHELRLLAEGARRAAKPLPVLIMHDVLWPYGRRDLYYEPSQIPEEFRQPYAKRGMRPGIKKLLERGGVNPELCNATQEGGPRNGVMTALDDFVAEHDRPLRVVVLPIYFGLAIVVEESRLAAQPELARVLDHLESAEGARQLLELAEDIRLRAVLFQHNNFFGRAKQLDRARQRYLDVVKSALLNEHYLDHEVRLDQLNASIQRGRPLEANQLRDPVRNDQVAYRRLTTNRSGTAGPDRGAATSFVPYAPMGRVQLDHLERCLGAVVPGIPGDLVECGTGRGGGAIFMRAFLDAHEIPDRRVFVADRFRAAEEGSTTPTIPARGVAGFRADLNLVRDGFERFGLLDDRVRFLQGAADSTLDDAALDRIALLRIGRSAGSDVRVVLDKLYDRISDGGYVIIDDAVESAARTTIDAFRRDRGIAAPIEPVDASAVAWCKEPVASRPPTTESGGQYPPLAPPAPTDAVDLSVVVVFYNMRREAARTLRSLSRTYQDDLGDVSYEVIVVENGSDPEQRLGEEFVTGFGPEFRYVDMADAADASPVAALNRGIRLGRGRAFALMIDGAHVLTPGVLHFGLTGLATYAPAVVVTQQWYVGPGQQGDAMDGGYDQDYEDRLFASIGWPNSGYRLFEIGHFIGDRDWLDGVWETNCLFVDRARLEQVGCFDESFSMPGGGYANLELYERLGSSPDVTVCTILGEGSFHQVHGGTTTNEADVAERRSRVFGYGQHYAQLRGRPFRQPGKPIHFVGRLPNQAARRSKPRRMSAARFAESASVNPDGFPARPAPVPQELTAEFTDAVWRSMPWRSTTWLGNAVRSAPTDLLAYQQLIVDVRPDWIVVVGAGDAGRALFLATVCELMGHGEVISISDEVSADAPHHPRLRHLVGAADADDVRDEVRRLVGSDRALVVLGACTNSAATLRQFEAYGPLVPVGSYVVVTDTIVNGHPVWPGFGPGPLEAVKQILAKEGCFVADPQMETYSLTFNPGGFLRRIA